MGVKYPQGQSPIYPPRDWDCPKCLKHHGKPHFPHPGQIDYTKNPTDFGRVVFNRANKNGDDSLDYSQTVRSEFIGKQGPMILDNKIQGLFCPHCGWGEHVINIIPEKGYVMVKGWKSIEAPDCCIKDCKSKATMSNDKLHFCKTHYGLVK